MPKVLLNQYDRKIDSFRKWFKGKRSSEDVTQKMLAKELNISQAAVSNKLSRKAGEQSEITYADLLVFFKATNATDEEIVRMLRI